MKHFTYKGKDYRIAYNGTVEVYVPAGELRVNRKQRTAHWRTLKAGSRTFFAIHGAAKTPINVISRIVSGF